MITGLCVSAALIVSVTVTASALATAPEVGRCLKQNTGAGKQFSDSKCTKEVAKGSSKDKYEWAPGVGARGKFTTSGGVGVLTQVSGTSVECKTESSAGEYVPGGNDKEEAGVVVKFNGCKSLGVGCNTPGAASEELITNELAGLVGWENKAKKKTALELSPAAGDPGGLFIEFSCSGLVVKVKGHVLVPVKNDKMTKTETLKFVAKKGKQKPEKWEESPTPAILEASFKGGPYEQSGQQITSTVTAEEELELNAVV